MGQNVKKMCTCVRCHSKIKLERKIIDGKIVCRSCYDIIIEEKKKGYKHGPNFGTLTDRCCLRCGVDLLLLEQNQVKKINKYEYCDVCAEKIKAVYDELKQYLSTQPVISSLDFDDENYSVCVWGKDKKNLLEIYLEDEISMFFSEWHSHYNLEENLELHINDLCDFYYELSSILYNEICVAYYLNEKIKCVTSSLIDKNEANEEYLRDIFGKKKKICCVFWDSKDDKVFEL